MVCAGGTFPATINLTRDCNEGVPMSEYTICEPDDLRRFTTQVLEATGMSPAGSLEMATQIVSSDLCGHESHGVRRLRQYVDRVLDKDVDPNAVPTIEHDSGSLVRLNGNSGYGHLVMQNVTDLLIERAREHGIAAIAAYNLDPAGRFVDFCERTADAGIASLFFLNLSGGYKSVAPPNGTEARLATNPIAAGIPRAGAPNIVVDMATSAVAEGRLNDSKERGIEVESDWVSKNGHLTSMGGVKGFALAIVIEALAGSLTGAGTVGNDEVVYRQGVLAIGIDIDKLRPIADFEADVAKFAQYLSDTPVEPGAPRVTMPGDRSAVNLEKRLRDGIPIHDVIWEKLVALSEQFNVELPKTMAK